MFAFATLQVPDWNYLEMLAHPCCLPQRHPALGPLIRDLLHDAGNFACLSFVDSDSLINRHLVWARRKGLSQTANIHVGLQAPVVWDVPLLLYCRLDRGHNGHVLQIRAHSFKLERGPDLHLSHGVGVLRPLAKHVRSGLVGFLRLLDGRAIFPKDYLMGFVSTWDTGVPVCHLDQETLLRHVDATSSLFEEGNIYKEHSRYHMQP